jgi:A118 family predicted phage portal protein
MFPIKNIQQALMLKPAISQEMVNKIDEWLKCYIGKAPWVEGEVISLRLESSIVREFARTSINEMSTNVSNEKLNTLLNEALEDLNPNLQRGLALGSFIIKPLESGEVQFVAANGYIPLEYSLRGRIRDIVFLDSKKTGDRYYTRFERHKLDNTGLTITNQAYLSFSANTIGRPVPLDSVEEWANLKEGTFFPKMDRMAFGYYRNPLDNVIDGSSTGISIYESALEKIQKADIQFGRLDYEFDSARRKIHADLSMVKQTAKGVKTDDLYVDVNGDADDFFKEFSPDLRQEGIIAGLEAYKREIEFDVGLSYGDLSKPQYVEKTATEVNASKIRKRSSVDQIQKQLRYCIDDLVYAFAFYNSLTKSGYEFSCEFKDSILNDEATERDEDRKDLANGTLRPEEYRSRWRNETIDEAKKNLPESSEVEE